jgi:hypothetical protein
MRRQTAGSRKVLDGVTTPWVGAIVLLALASILQLPTTTRAGQATHATGISHASVGGMNGLGPWWRGAVVLATGGSVSLGTYIMARRRNRVERGRPRDTRTDTRLMDACRREISGVAEKDDELVIQVLREWVDGGDRT